MAVETNQPVMRWMGRSLKSSLARIVLLVLALLPTGIVVLMAIRIWLSGDTASWQGKIWPVVALQVVSIAAFWVHASLNKKLASGELGGWILQFIVYIPFGMISYWREHVWGNDQ
jgi:hypothetical protein